jgi:hypothetical protein
MMYDGSLMGCLVLSQDDHGCIPIRALVWPNGWLAPNDA